VQCGGHSVSPWSPVDPSTSRAWAGRVTMRHRGRYAPHSVRSPNGHSTWADARLGPVRRHPRQRPSVTTRLRPPTWGLEPEEDSNPRPSDYETNARRRTGRLQPDRACSGWMPRRSRRIERIVSDRLEDQADDQPTRCARSHSRSTRLAVPSVGALSARGAVVGRDSAGTGLGSGLPQHTVGP
jgi:hypothetical protein